MFSVLGDKIFPGKRFYQPLVFETQTGSEPNTNKFQTKKHVLNESFVHSLTRYHAHITTFFKQVDDLDDFQKLRKTFENANFCMCGKTASESNFLMFYTVFQFVISC